MLKDFTEEQRSRLADFTKITGMTEEEAIQKLISYKKRQFNTKDKIEQELANHNIDLQLRVKIWLETLYDSIDSYDLQVMEQFFERYPDKATLENVPSSKEFIRFKCGGWLHIFKKFIDKLLPDSIDRKLFYEIYDDLFKTVSIEIRAMVDNKYGQRMSNFLVGSILYLYPHATITLNWINNLEEVVSRLQGSMSLKESQWFFKMYYRYLESSKDFSSITNIGDVINDKYWNTYSIYTDEDLEYTVVAKLIDVIDNY